MTATCGGSKTQLGSRTAQSMADTPGISGAISTAAMQSHAIDRRVEECRKELMSVGLESVGRSLPRPTPLVAGLRPATTDSRPLENCCVATIRVPANATVGHTSSHVASATGAADVPQRCAGR